MEILSSSKTSKHSNQKYARSHNIFLSYRCVLRYIADSKSLSLQTWKFLPWVIIKSKFNAFVKDTFAVFYIILNYYYVIDLQGVDSC